MVPVNEELRMAQESKKSQRKEVGRMTETDQTGRQPRGTPAMMLDCGERQ